jgi:hypothetical protein
MPRENVNQSMEPEAALSTGEPDRINDPLIKPSPFISSAGLVNALSKPSILAILWAGVFAHLWKLFETLGDRVYRWDFSLYYLTSYAQAHGLNPYTTDLTPLARGLHLSPGMPGGNFLDLPVMMIAMEPLTWLSVPAAYWTWFAINVVALALALFLLLRGHPAMRPRFLLAWLALAFLHPSVGMHFYYAQSQILVLLMLVLIMRWTEWDWRAAAGLMFGLASILRAYPQALACYFIVRRNWRALIFGAIAMAACFALTVAFAGLDPWRGFLLQLSVHTVDDHSGSPANVALVHTVSRLLALIIGDGTAFPLQITRLVAATFANLAIVMLSLKVTADSWQQPDEDWRVYSLWVVTMLLVSPVTWVHSLILLLLPFAKLTIAAVEGRTSRRAMWMAVVSYAMISLASGWHQSVGTYDTNQLSAWVAELSPLSLIAAYLSVYWFATDRDFPAAESAVDAT